MKIVTLITTYNRRKAMLNLLKLLCMEIETSAALGYEHFFIVADDGSDPAYYEAINELLNAYGVKNEIIVHTKNNGKQGYYHVVNSLYEKLEATTYDYAIQLPDDVTPCIAFYQEAVAAINAVGTHKVVNLMRCHRDQEWGSQPAVEAIIKGVALRLTGWVDMCFIADRHAMDAIHHRVNPVYRDWHLDPELGSGVGAQLSRRWRTNGTDQWQVQISRVNHNADLPSQMNPNRKFKFKTK